MISGRPGSSGGHHLAVIFLRCCLENSLETYRDLIELDIKTTSHPEQRAEPGIGSPPLQLADAIERRANSIGKLLLGQAGLTAQLLNRLPEGTVRG